jgi:flagellar motor component MotA
MFVKTILKTIIGLILCFGSIVLGYLFLDGLASGVNYLLLAGAIFLVAGGVFCLVIAGKSDALGVKKVKSEPSSAPQGPNVFERNNSMLKDYQETGDKRDKLKMLEAAGDSNVL